jgi:hypothetical protein
MLRWSRKTHAAQHSALRASSIDHTTGHIKVGAHHVTVKPRCKTRSQTGLVAHQGQGCAPPPPRAPRSPQLTGLSSSVSSADSLYFGSMMVRMQPGQVWSRQSRWSCPEACLRWP